MIRRTFVDLFTESDFLQPDFFNSLCDVSFTEKYTHYNGVSFAEVEKIAKTKNTPFIFSTVENFPSLLKLEIPFVAILGDADGTILPEGKTRPHCNNHIPDITLRGLPDNVIKVYAQNLDYEHDRIVPLPIALENDRWFPQLQKLKRIFNLMKNPISKTNLLYVNHRIWTNPTSRAEPYTLLSGKPWCTLEQGENGQAFDNFISKIASHKFMLCPDGNGLDTHRAWESLYVGTIPIVERHVATTEFSKHLPMLVIDNWSEVTEDYLNKIWNEFTCKEWNWEYLTKKYWRDKIESLKKC